jgi:uncharacterized repeat protein (TIGR01451 family)
MGQYRPGVGSGPLFCACSTPGIVLALGDPSTNQYPGELVTYTVLFGNRGGADALGVVVSDTLPAEVNFESTSMGAYDAVAHEVVWTGDLLADSAYTATIVVRIDAGTVPTTWMTNTAYLFYGAMEPLMDTASHYAQPIPVTTYYLYLPMIYKKYSAP